MTTKYLAKFHSLVDKLADGIRSVAHRLKAVQLLLYVVCKQPMWIHKIMTQSVFTALLKCLKVYTIVIFTTVFGRRLYSFVHKTRC
jgi:hypothetical protein